MTTLFLPIFLGTKQHSSQSLLVQTEKKKKQKQRKKKKTI